MINENKLRQAILSDFENLLVAEFTADWKIKRFLIEMYLSVMNLDNTKKFICSLNETQQEKIVDNAVLIQIDGKNFKCKFGGNVFSKIDNGKYICNACGESYVGE